MSEHKQQRVPGGHLITLEAEVGDGHVKIEDRWQDVLVENEEDPLGDPVVVGSALTLRTAYINGHLVKDPDYARALWREAVSQHDHD
jgi:hypothetical protein